MLESIVSNVSGLAEKYASHLISQCPAEVKEEMLKYEKQRKKLDEEAETNEAAADKAAGAKQDSKGKQNAESKAGEGKAKDKKNSSARSDDDKESSKTQYVEVNKKMNTELVRCKQKIDKALQSMWDYVHVSNKLSKGQMERSLNGGESGQYEGLLRKFVAEMN